MGNGNIKISADIKLKFALNSIPINNKEIIEAVKLGALLEIDNDLNHPPTPILNKLLANTENITPQILTIVQYIINKGAETDKQNIDFPTPIVSAIQKGSFKLVELLFDENSGIDLCSNLNSSLINLAINNGNIDIVKLLIQKGALANTIDGNLFISPLEQAASSNEEIFNLILENTDIQFINYKTLNAAALAGNLNYYKQILNKINEAQILNVDNVNIMASAIKSGNEDFVQYLLEEDFHIVETEHSNSILGLAIKSNLSLKLIKKLQNFGAKINPDSDQIYSTPLMTAIENDNNEIIEYLLENNANVNSTNPKLIGTPLTSAILQKNLPLIKILIEEFNANINYTNEDYSILSVAVASGNIDIVKYLLSQNVELKWESESSNLIFQAITSKNIEMLEFVLKNDDLPPAPQSSQEYLEFVCSTIAKPLDQDIFIKLLLENGATVHTVDYQKRALIDRSEADSRHELVEILTQYGEVINLNNQNPPLWINEYKNIIIFFPQIFSLIFSNVSNYNPNLFKHFFYTELEKTKFINDLRNDIEDYIKSYTIEVKKAQIDAKILAIGWEISETQNHINESQERINDLSSKSYYDITFEKEKKLIFKQIENLTKSQDYKENVIIKNELLNLKDKLTNLKVLFKKNSEQEIDLLREKKNRLRKKMNVLNIIYIHLNRREKKSIAYQTQHLRKLKK